LETVTRDLELQGISYSQDEYELLLVLNVLLEEGFLEAGGPGSLTLSIKGVLAAEALGASGSGAQGFVAMSLDPSLRDVFTHGFDPGIRAAGYDPFRIDDRDYVGGITDEMIAQIKRSRFVVADYTGHRNNVYFEAVLH
jgi:hypothetical protein